MFKHILVPTDLTERSLTALDVAVKMAIHDSSLVTLLHVVETIEDGGSEDFTNFYSKLGKRAAKLMDKIIGGYQNERISITPEITYGKRVREIVRYARDKQIDLIILSSHKVDAIDSVQGWGTISYKVGILAHCPVMLVK